MVTLRDDIKGNKRYSHMPEPHTTQREKADELIKMASECRNKSDTKGILEYSYKALDICESENYLEGSIGALNLIGIAFFYNAMYEESAKHFIQVMDLLKYFDNDYLLMKAFNNIGEVLRETEKYDAAMEYYVKADKIAGENNFYMENAAIFSNMGEVHFSLDDMESALDYFNRSYGILIKTDNIISRGEIINRIGNIYMKNGEYERAERYFLKAVEILEEMDNKYFLIEAFISLGNLYKRTSLKESIYYYNKALEYAENIDAKKKIFKVCNHISECYEIEGDYKLALYYFKRFSNTKNEVASMNLGNRIEALTIQLRHVEEADRIQQMRERLEKELKYQRIELQRIQIENAILEKKAFQDELTGVSNRRSLDILLARRLNSELFSHKTIALFIIDIDYFKKYNDYWGHLEGDECLKKIAKSIDSLKAKRNDEFFRYGGEEFVYISIGMNLQQAVTFGNLLRDEIRKLDLYYYNGDQKSYTTISVGGVVGKIGEFPNKCNIMDLADKQLYRAKKEGRNKTFLIEYGNK